MRFRAREDGENPSPPRDCKAKEIRARVTAPEFSSKREDEEWEGRAADALPGEELPGSEPFAKPGDRRSLNPDEVARATVGIASMRGCPILRSESVAREVRKPDFSG